MRILQQMRKCGANTYLAYLIAKVMIKVSQNMSCPLYHFHKLTFACWKINAIPPWHGCYLHDLDHFVGLFLGYHASPHHTRSSHQQIYVAARRRHILTDMMLMG